MWEQPYNTYLILNALAYSNRDSMTVSELTDILDLSIQQISRAVNNLYRYHWLHRRRTPCNYNIKGWIYGYKINSRGMEYLKYKNEI